MTLSLRTDRNLIRAAGRSVRYILASVDAPSAPRRAERLPVNIALVLDRSGSMSDSRKFDLARDAVEQALRMLQPGDRFSLVVYDDRVDVLARSMRAEPSAVRRALDAMSSIEPRGSTDLGGGWLRGCEQVAEFLGGEVVSRCLLLSDGLANCGITDRDELARHAAELRRRGVVTSTFGVGADFDERLMRDMAHEGGGNFYFIEGASQIPDLLTGELGEALEVVMRDAALQITLPRGARAEPLGRQRFTVARGDNEVRIELGDLVSSQVVDVVVKVTFPTGEVGSRQSVRVGLSTTRELLPGTSTELTWTYASHAENDRQDRDRVVDREVAQQYAARVRTQAAELNRIGDFERAQGEIERVAHRIRAYAAADDGVMKDLLQRLEEELPTYAAALPQMEMKRVLYESELMQKSRGGSGKARRKI